MAMRMTPAAAAHRARPERRVRSADRLWKGITALLLLVGGGSFGKTLQWGDVAQSLWRAGPVVIGLVLAAAVSVGLADHIDRRRSLRRRDALLIPLPVVVAVVLVVLFTYEPWGGQAEGTAQPRPDRSKQSGRAEAVSRGYFAVDLLPNTLTPGFGAAYGATTANRLVEFSKDALTRGGEDLAVRVVAEDLPAGITRMVACGDGLYVATSMGLVAAYSPVDGHVLAHRQFYDADELELACVGRADERPRLFAVRSEGAEAVRLDIDTPLLDSLSEWTRIRKEGYEGPADVDTATGSQRFAHFSDTGRSQVHILDEEDLDVDTVEDVADAQTLNPVGSKLVAAQPLRHCASVIDVATATVSHLVAMGSSRSYGGAYGDEAYFVDESGEATIFDAAKPPRQARHFHVSDAPTDAAVTAAGDLVVATRDRVDVFGRTSLRRAARSAAAAWPLTPACGLAPAPTPPPLPLLAVGL
ncbi:MAG TPA: hypothetical protein VF520_03775 [Thermoleophilaceae bacterium]